MGNKSLLLVILAMLFTGAAFAQTEAEAPTGAEAQTEFETAQEGVKTPKNTITVDLGPTIIGLGIKVAGKILSQEDEGISTSGFGIGVQYERQILEKLSVGARFAYLGGGIGYSITDSYKENGIDVEGRADLEMKISSFSLEGHARYYPFKKRTFFLDGMLGYANMAVNFNGEIIVTSNGIKEKESADLKVSRNYLKLGGKFGWRIDFGKPGGFTFEPALGYYAGIGLGDSIGKKLSNKLGGDVDDVGDVFSYAEKFIFVGGPRATLAFGWRF